MHDDLIVVRRWLCIQIWGGHYNLELVVDYSLYTNVKALVIKSQEEVIPTNMQTLSNGKYSETTQNTLQHLKKSILLIRSFLDNII